MSKIDKREYRWALWASLGIVLLASIPYLFGYAIAPEGYKFTGLTFNVDDASVYLSWMRQSADGHFFLRNLFTTEPQNARGFNLLFYVLGTFARITHLPLIAVFHLSRVLFGIALLLAIYALVSLWLPDMRSRRIAFLVTGTSAGLGWLLPLNMRQNLSIDTWQGESITFLSIYLSPLFSFPTLLMVGVVFFLYRFSQTHMWKYAVFAGLCLLTLADVHTYDCITLAITWSVYSLYRLLRRPHDPLPMIGGLVALVVASPLVAYQLHYYATDAVFKTRVAVPTVSPELKWYLMGYGPLIVLALIGVWQSIRERRDIALPLCWACAGIIGVCLPVSFQRKLIMGTHIPLSLLAAMGLISLTNRFRPTVRTALVTAAVLAMMLSNMNFLMRDMCEVMNNQTKCLGHVPFISANELNALEYLRTHAGAGDVVLATPGIAMLVPGYAGRTVYAAHWGETVDFNNKIKEVLAFFGRTASDEARRDILKTNRITYVIGYHSVGDIRTDTKDFRESPVPYLRPVFDTEEVSVYQVARDSL